MASYGISRDAMTELIFDGPHEYWHESTGDDLHRAVAQLIERDWGIEEACDFVAGLYGAVANEFGA